MRHIYTHTFARYDCWMLIRMPYGHLNFDGLKLDSTSSPNTFFTIYSSLMPLDRYFHQSLEFGIEHLKHHPIDGDYLQFTEKRINFRFGIKRWRLFNIETGLSSTVVGVNETRGCTSKWTWYNTVTNWFSLTDWILEANIGNGKDGQTSE